MVDITKEENKTKDKSIVNRLRDIFVNRRLTFTIENFGKFDYRNLMNNKDILIDTNVTDKFDELNTTYHFQINQKNKRNVNYIMKLVNDEMMKLGLKLNYSRSDIVDMLIVYLFKLKDSEHKNVLLSCFGDVIVENLKNNIPEDSIQCEKCGHRFMPNYHNEKLCDKCSVYQPMGTKVIVCIDCSKEVNVDALDNQTNRCKECYNTYRRKVINENAKKYYQKKKNK